MEDRRVFPYGSPLLKRVWEDGYAKGYAKTCRKNLLKVLRWRGLKPSAEQLNAIETCIDEDQFDHWFDRALTANSLDDVFVD